jgi:hypothetical protein
MIALLGLGSLTVGSAAALSMPCGSAACESCPASFCKDSDADKAPKSAVLALEPSLEIVDRPIPAVPAARVALPVLPVLSSAFAPPMRRRSFHRVEVFRSTMRKEFSMKRLIVTLSVAFILAASALATTSSASSLVCEKTGVVVDSCCCVVQDGRMICTLTGGRSRPAAVPPASEQAAGLPGRRFSSVRAGALPPLSNRRPGAPSPRSRLATPSRRGADV